MTNLMTRHVKRATVFTMMLMSIFHAGAKPVPDYEALGGLGNGHFRLCAFPAYHFRKNKNNENNETIVVAIFPKGC